MSIDLTLPAASAPPLVLDASPGATTAPSGDGRRLAVRYQDLRITPR